ncbi:MAG: hypothetical protein EOO91_16395 [Pedobacter sp.]|nr:MAG: hypothetical protein EOO91_16395 [Pedobacter sp.]
MLKFKWTVILSILTPILLIITIIFMGGGHGNYQQAIVLFPTGLLSILMFNRIEIGFVIIAIIQYPLYGFLIDKATDKKKMILILLLFHIALALSIFLCKSETWS